MGEESFDRLMNAMKAAIFFRSRARAWKKLAKKYREELATLKRSFGIDKCDLIFCEDPACSKNNPRT